MSATLPHVHAVKYRNELEAERARVAELSSRVAIMEKERAVEREKETARFAAVQSALDRCVAERDELQVESSRAK
jgi:hypothetical protein